MRNWFLVLGAVTAIYSGPVLAQDTPNPNISEPQSLTWYDYPEVELRALDKITAEATTFKVKVGKSAKFGKLYMKVQSCRKPPAIEKVESAAFVQVWEKPPREEESKWVFSGWMFASSPSVSAMDHPIYDVWLLDCIGPDPEPKIEPEPDPSPDSIPEALEETAQEESSSFESMLENLEEE